MYRSVASVAQDDASILAGAQRLHSVLFIEVDDPDDVERALAAVKPLFERRRSEEVRLPDPAGNVITFAHFSAA